MDREARALIKKVDSLWLQPDQMLLQRDTVRYLMARCLEQRRPVIGLSRAYVEAGALFCLQPEFDSLGRQLARGLQRRLKARPAGGGSASRAEAPEQLPQVGTSLETPRSFRVIVNSRVARMLGLEIPQGLVGTGDIEILY